jgi:hypothetical protein
MVAGAAPGQRTYDQSASAAVANVSVMRNWPVVIMVGPNEPSRFIGQGIARP